MRTIALLVPMLLALSLPAQARPASYKMTCAAVQAMVGRQGAVVMDTSPSTFDRYVSTLRACMPGQALKPQWVPARDTPQCFAGYTCIDPDRGWYRWGF
ncbi:MAG: hypothetical protein AB1592_00945 [Pseudomonadota bacterium]